MGIIHAGPRSGNQILRPTIRAPEKEKKWDGTEAVPPTMHEFRPFYAPGVDAGESAGAGEGESGAADAGVADGAGVGFGLAKISSRRFSN